MRILHTSDWHFGIQLYGVSLLEEQRAVVDALAALVKTQAIDVVAIAGDIFDNAVVAVDAVRLYSEAMETLCLTCGVKVLLCAGNHDGAARLASCGALLRDAGLYVAGRLSDGVEPVVLDDAAFFLLPYFNTDEARYLYPKDTLRNASEAMSRVCRDLLERRVPGKRNILIAHCFVMGGQPGESDRTAVLGGAGNIDSAAFEGFDYVALGHLHRAQLSRSEGVIVRYSGTPYPYSFQEAGQEKSVTILDTNTMEVTAVPLRAGRGMRVLQGAYKKLLEIAPWDLHRDDYLKIEMTDCAPGLGCMTHLREHYPNLLRLEGITPAGRADEPDALTISDIDTLRPRDLVLRFGREIGGIELDVGLLELFAELSRETNGEEGEAQ